MLKPTRKLFNGLLTTNKNNLILLTNRYYVRWQHRRPKRIYANEQELETEISKRHRTDILEDSIDKYSILKEAQKSTKTTQFYDSIDKTAQETNLNIRDKLTDQSKLVKKFDNNHSILKNYIISGNQNSDSDAIETVKIDKDNITFEKLGPNDRKLSKLMTNVKLKKYRERNKIVLLEGKRLIRDALLANCVPEVILFSRITDLDSFKELLLDKKVEFYKVPYKDLQLWSSLTTSPGIMGIFKVPDTSERLDTVSSSLPITIICDNVREPGNLGTIIRIAAAAGCQRLLLTKGCVDLWEPKVLRSACGAHFRLIIQPNVTWEDIKFRFKNPSVFIADNNTETCFSFEFASCSYDNIHFQNHSEIALIIGGETHGISQDAYSFAKNFMGTKVHIPLENGVESLNTGAAFAVIIFEMRRQFQALDKLKLENNYQASSI